MNGMRGTILGLALGLGALAASAQDSAIPLKQIERDVRSVQLPARAALSADEAVSVNAPEMFTRPAPSSGFVRVPATPKRPRILSKSFLLLNGLHLGMAVFDVEMTQHCIADHHCVEGNPLMPSSQAGQLAVNFALAGSGTFISYRLKRQGSNLWMLSPSVGIAAHSVGVASGFAHR